MTSRVFVTGGAWFIGRAVVRQLCERGDDVTAVVRDTSRAASLTDLGVRLVESDLGSVTTVREAMTGCDAVVHLAGSYRVGIMPSERPAMYEINVSVAARVLDAAIEAAVPRIVAVSTANVLGDTGGRVVNETHERNPEDGFLSWYDETKVLAHRIAEARIADGAPIVIAMPGTTYGPGDHSAIGAQLKAAFDGKAVAIVFGNMGITAVHVDDLASGLLAVLDRGRIGESYLLTGECLTLEDAMGAAARAAVLRIAEPLAGVAMRLGLLKYDLTEALRAGDDVTYWASHGKATAELGFRPRPLSQGAVDAFGRS